MNHKECLPEEIAEDAILLFVAIEKQDRERVALLLDIMHAHVEMLLDARREAAH